MEPSSLVAAVTIPVAAAAVAAYLGRVAVKFLIDRDVERYRSELQRASLEHEVRFSRLHERQAEIIAEVFGRLEVVHQAFRLWASTVAEPGLHSALKTASRNLTGDLANLRDEAFSALNEFVRYYHPKAIWLDPNTCEAINQLVVELQGLFFELRLDIDEKGLPTHKGVWDDVLTTLEEEMPKARGLLDQRFREILGVPARPTVRPAPRASKPPN